MTEYCTSSDVQNRLTAAGYRFVADRDADGSVSASELAAYVTAAIENAGTIVDSYLVDLMEPTHARAQSNTWLKYRCVDLAAFLALHNGGRAIPESVRQTYDWATQELERVRDGGKIPDLVYPKTASGVSTRVPRLVNVFRRRR